MTTITASEPTVNLIDVLRFLLDYYDRLSTSDKSSFQNIYRKIEAHGTFSKSEVNFLMSLFVQFGGWSFKIEDSDQAQITLDT